MSDGLPVIVPLLFGFLAFLIIAGIVSQMASAMSERKQRRVLEEKGRRVRAIVTTSEVRYAYNRSSPLPLRSALPSMAYLKVIATSRAPLDSPAMPLTARGPTMSATSRSIYVFSFTMPPTSENKRRFAVGTAIEVVVDPVHPSIYRLVSK